MISRADCSRTSRTYVDFPYAPLPTPAILGRWEAAPAPSSTQVLTRIRTRPCYLPLPSLTFPLTPPEPVRLCPWALLCLGTGSAPALQALSLALWVTQRVPQ